METNQNYEELKDGAKSVLQMVTSNNLYYGILLLIVMIVSVKLIDLVFLPFRKARKETILMSFIKACLKAFVIITLGIRILSLSEAMSGFASQILMSSSLIVVVLGFVFQEGLSNIVHGFILSIFKPFSIGDRVHILVDGMDIIGYIQTIDLRNTVIRNAINSSHVIVPNAKMDLCVIENTFFSKDQDHFSTSFVDFCITYDSDLEKTIALTQELVLEDPAVQRLRKEKQMTDPVPIIVTDLGPNGVSIRTVVQTLTAEEGIGSCSDIRRAMVRRFSEEKDVLFAYPHMSVVTGTGQGMPRPERYEQ